MDKFKQDSLDAEIERYTKQLMSSYRLQAAAVPTPPPPVIVPPPPPPNMITPPPTVTPPPPMVTPPPVIAPPPEPILPPEPPPAPPKVSPPAALTPEQEFKRFAEANPQRGRIKTQAFTARGTYPVKDVQVVISKEFESGEYIISTQMTDIAGKTEPVVVPAPDVDLSELPGQKLQPFSTYKVTFTHPSFATTVSQQLPVFSGTTAMQTVNLVPVSAAPNGSTTIEYITTEPSDL